MKRFILGGLFLIAILLSVQAAARIVTPDFSPSDKRIDLSRESDTALLGSDWDIRPVPKWRGVVEVFDRGSPAVIPIELPSANSWMFRFKLLFLKPDAKVRVSFNGEPLGTWEPKQVGQAEKFQVLLPATAVKPGINQIEFTPAGTPASVIYEQVRLLNFRSKLWKHHLYLIPASEQSKPGFRPVVFAGIFAAAALGALLLWFLTAGLVSIIGAWQFSGVFVKQSAGWVFVAAVAATLGYLPILSSYQLIGSALGYWAMITLIWITAQLPFFLAAVLRRISQIILTGSQLIDAYGPEGLNALQRLGRMIFWFLKLLLILIYHLIYRLLVQIVRLFIWVVRWIWRNQHPFGYLKMAGIFLAVALISPIFKWTAFHDSMSHAAGVCVLIAMTKEALRSLKADSSDNPSAVQ